MLLDALFTRLVRNMNIEEKIAEIISSNDLSVASKVIAEVMGRLADGGWCVIGYDSAEEFIEREIDKICENHFG